MELLYGKPVADKILEHLKDAIFKYEKKPGLAVVLVGQDEASKLYVSLKEKTAKKIGMEFFKYLVSSEADESEILTLIDFLNKDSEIHGIIVQLPLAKKFDTEKIISSIDPKKDVDGFHPSNAAKFLQGDAFFWPVFPLAIMSLVEESKQGLENKKAFIIANSRQFGEMMVAAARQKKLKAEYILAVDIPSNLGEIKASDVVVSAVGSPGLLRGEMLKDGAIIIDGGIEKVADKVLGDVDFASTEGKEGFLTPVPGGVGPVTIAYLLSNTFSAFEAEQKEKKH